MKTLLTRTLILLALILLFNTGFSQVPQAERDALMALYNATDGPNWINSTNWNTAEPVADWYGVNAGDHVIMIALYANNLTGTLPAELGVLTDLTFLGLDENQLTGSIPPELGNLTNLLHLNLTINQLTGNLPIELGNLTNLQELHLSNNQFTGTIPSELGNLSNLQNFTCHLLIR